MPGTNQAWRCAVCGYVHRGPERPEACPVCGAPRELFEPQADSPSPAIEPAVNQWQCLVCGYVHAGSQPPAECPACGARADCFEPVSDTASPGDHRSLRVSLGERRTPRRPGPCAANSSRRTEASRGFRGSGGTGLLIAI